MGNDPIMLTIRECHVVAICLTKGAPHCRCHTFGRPVSRLIFRGAPRMVMDTLGADPL